MTHVCVCVCVCVCLIYETARLLRELALMWVYMSRSTLTPPTPTHLFIRSQLLQHLIRLLEFWACLSDNDQNNICSNHKRAHQHKLYKYIWSIFKLKYTRIRNIHTCANTQTCAHTRTHARIHACTHARKHAQMHMHKC